MKHSISRHYLASSGLSIFAVLALFWSAACIAAPKSLTEQKGKFRNTWYYLPMEQDFPGASIARVLDMEGNTLALVPQSFLKDLLIEGSGKLRDGRVVNFAGRVGKETRFKFVDAPFGLGVKECHLEPLHSIAVDPRTIPLGSVVRIQETIGLRFPDGTIHNGTWKAVDVGSAIQGDRVDLFMGAGKANGKFLESAGIDHYFPLTVTILSTPKPDDCTQK